MSDELADRLAVAAGWKHIDNFGAKFWHRGQCHVTHAHPFPVGRIDPILDLMRERGYEPVRIKRSTDGSLYEYGPWYVLLNHEQMPPSHGTGPDLWTALASAVLAAMEKKP